MVKRVCALQPVGHLPGRDWHGGSLRRPGPLLTPGHPGPPNPWSAKPWRLSRVQGALGAARSLNALSWHTV